MNLYQKCFSEFERNILIKIIQERKLPFLWHIKSVKRIRTVPQNKLYWLWIGIIIDENSGRRDDALKDQIHKLLKDNFIRFQNEIPETDYDNFAIIAGDRKTYTVFGKDIQEEYSTTKLDTIEFGKYMKLIQAYFKDFGIQVFFESDADFASQCAYYQQFI